MSKKGLFFFALGLGLGAGAAYLYKKGYLRPSIEVEIIEGECPEACCAETEPHIVEPACDAEAFGPHGEAEACMHVPCVEQVEEVANATAAEPADDTVPECPPSDTAGDEVSDAPAPVDEAE